MDQISSFLLLGFEGTDKDLLITFGLDGAGIIPPPPPPDNPIRNFEERRYDLRHWRDWKRDDDVSDSPDIPEAAAQIIESVAARQADEPPESRLNEGQRIQELQNELALAGIESQRIYYEALAAERTRIIDAEIRQRLQLELDNRNATALLMLAVI